MLQFRPMQEGDIPAALALWTGMPGISLRQADAPEALAKYLQRNPGLSVVAYVGEQLAGVALAGHDGRRGYLHHVAVDPTLRRRGLGREIVQRCLSGLIAEGIAKCHILVDGHNDEGKAFWRAIGWAERGLQLMSMTTGDENA